MRKFLSPLLLIFLLAGSRAQAQKKDTSFIYLDSNLNVTPKKTAVCVESVVHRDGLWYVEVGFVDRPYKIMTGSYKDRTLEHGEGLFEYFKDDTLVMSGSYHDGVQQGIWKKWTTSGLLTDSVGFFRGLTVLQAKFQYHVNNHLWRYSLTTNDDEKITRVYDTTDVLISAGRFKGTDGEVFFYYPSGKVKTHAVYKNNERTLYEAFDEDGKRI